MTPSFNENIQPALLTRFLLQQGGTSILLAGMLGEKYHHRWKELSGDEHVETVCTQLPKHEWQKLY